MFRDLESGMGRGGKGNVQRVRHMGWIAFTVPSVDVDGKASYLLQKDDIK